MWAKIENNDASIGKAWPTIKGSPRVELKNGAMFLKHYSINGLKL